MLESLRELVGTEHSATEEASWEVRRSSSASGGAWVPFDDQWRDLDQPVSLDRFELNTSALEPGTYRLFRVDDDGQLAPPPDDKQWALEIDSDTDRDLDEEQLEEVRAAVERLEAEVDAQRVEPSEIADGPAELIALKMADNEEFLAQYGWLIAEKGFGLRDDQRLDADDVEGGLLSVLGMVLVDAYEHPERFRELGGHLAAVSQAFHHGRPNATSSNEPDGTRTSGGRGASRRQHQRDQEADGPLGASLEDFGSGELRADTRKSDMSKKEFDDVIDGL